MIYVVWYFVSGVHGIGAFGLVYRAGDPFMLFFVCLGSVLLLSGYALARQGTASA